MKKNVYLNIRLWLLAFLFFQLPSLHAQNVRLVNMDLSNTTFPEAVEAFQKETGIKFLYNLENVKNLRCKDLRLINMSSDRAVSVIMNAFNLKSSIVEGVVIVNDQPVRQSHTTRTVSGSIADAHGTPRPGVTIIQKGTTVGLTSDINGNFNMIVPSNIPITLLFSFVGMETKEVEVKDDKPIHVTMYESSTQLEEAVVQAGYQKIPRKDMVGSFTTVKADDIMLDAYTSIDQMLQGRIAGLVAVNSSSRVGRNPQITIRGTSTILGNTDPLWVVDGIIQPDPMPFNVNSGLMGEMGEMIANQISWLNPNDIEDVTVLKDASATAIYGSKASNGVIVITTKKGKTDRISVRYSLKLGMRIRSNYNKFNYMNSQERIQFAKEAYDAGIRYQAAPIAQPYSYEGLMKMLNDRLITEDDYNNQVSWLETVNTDWFALLLRNSFSNSHNLNISGGSEKTTYTASLSYTDNRGVEIGNETDQFTARLNVNSQISNKIRLDFSINGSMGNNYGYGPGVSPLSYATQTSRSLPAYDQEGNRVFYKSRYNYSLNSSPVELGFNIFNEMENGYSKTKSNHFDVNLNLNWEINSWLGYTLVTSISTNSNLAEAFAGEKTTYIAQNYRGYDYGTADSESDLYKAALLPHGGELLTNNITFIDYNMQHLFTFNHEFNEDNRLNAMVAAEVRSTQNRMESNTVWGLVPERGDKIMRPNTDIVPIGSTQTPDDLGILGNLYESGQWNLMKQTDNFFALFATLAYSFKNRYTLNANIRNDVSNRFGQDANKRIDPTYSFGLQWRIGEENFIKDHVNWINQMNLRATFGLQGNVVSSLSPELILNYGDYESYVYNEYFVGISSIPNPLLNWERTKTWNLGIDLQLFKDLSINVEYYGRRSNAIVDQDIPNEYGKTTMKLNGGHINNSGIEISINATPLKRDNFTWTVGFNTSKNWNRAETAIRNNGTEVITKTDFLNGNSNRILQKGKPLDAFWSYSFAGLDPQNGYPTFNKLEYDVVDAAIDPSTFLVYSGQKNPFITGGLNTSFRYKSVSFSTSFNLLIGGKKRLPNPYSNFSGGKMPDASKNLLKDLNDRWKQQGDEAYTNLPALWTNVDPSIPINLPTPDGTTESRYSMWSQSDIRVVNASFLRCAQMSLSWQMPARICHKFGATSFSVNASTSNVFVICSKKFNGFDPELGNSVMPRMFSFGFNVGF